MIFSETGSRVSGSCPDGGSSLTDRAAAHRAAVFVDGGGQGAQAGDQGGLCMLRRFEQAAGRFSETIALR